MIGIGESTVKEELELIEPMANLTKPIKKIT